MPSICLPAFAKVNLCLRVVGRRPDGYHELRTVFQTISLCDELRMETTRRPAVEVTLRSPLELSSADRAVLAGRENLVVRALRALRRSLSLRSGFCIELTKNIPLARGLGGGSSDAAGALLGAVRLSGRRVPLDRLHPLAARLGADVPFFLYGGRALGVGRGDEIYLFPDIPRRAVVVVSPRDISVSTPAAYGWLARSLTKHHATPRLWSFCALCWSPQGGGIENDFEAAVFPRHPRLRQIKRTLLQRGAAGAALAGSGSAVFAVFSDPALARRAAQWFPDDRVFIGETVSRGEYLRALSGRGAG